MGPVRKALASPWLYRIVRWALGTVFVVAGVAKISDVQGFAVIISRYELVPEAWVAWVAYGLPILEILAGIGLILDLPLSLSLITIMLIFFIGVLWFGVVSDMDIDCGCFSPSELAEQNGLKDAMIRDLFMLAGCVYLFVWRWTAKDKKQRRGLVGAL